MIQAGQYVTDGTAVFLVCDIRDGAQVGDIKMSPVLRKGYVQANGALLSNASTNYPRLVAFVQENPSLLAADDSAWDSNKALYVYDDTNDTLRVPDATGRVLQGGESVQSVEAGLPNITGNIDPVAGHSLSIGVSSHSGALTANSSATLANHTSSGSYSSEWGINFDASLSNPIYSASTTVQPPALSLIPQIKY